MKGRLLMPAVYRFDIPNRPEESRWEWHKGSELLEALQSILMAEGGVCPTAEEICNRFVDLHPAERRTDNVPGYAPYLKIKNGKLWTSGRAVDWLRHDSQEGVYLPAKIGTKLIDAAKQPIPIPLKLRRLESA